MHGSTWPALIAVGLLVVNCLVWGTLLTVCGVCVLSDAATRSPVPSVTAVVRASSVPSPAATRSPVPSRTPVPTPAPTAQITWIANPTVSWSTRPAPSPTLTSLPHPPTPWPTQVIQGPDAETKIQALFALAAIGPDIPFRVVFTEDEIEQMIARNLAQQPEAPYRNVTVELTQSEVIVSGQVNVSGLWLDATIHAQVTVRDGKPAVTVTRVDLGAIPLPGRVRDEVTSALQGALAGLENLPVRFTAITLGTGCITFQGVTK